MNLDSIISQERIRREKMSRFNPIRGLTPALLVQNMEMFKTGYLPPFTRMWDAIEERCDTTKSCSIKRRAAPAALPWEIIPFPEAEKGTAEKHAEALTFAYRHLTATNAIDQDDEGGFSKLIEAMLTAIGARYSVHELIWQPKDGGLTAKFNWVPPWFFESRSGKLRYIPQEGLIDGVEMNPEQWMVTVGDCLGMANSICYVFKTLSLRDWTIYCERHGMPIVHGKVDAGKGSPAWESMKEIVATLAAECSAVTGVKDLIEVIDMTAQGQLPYPIMVERMDRGIATLWRGADLSTMSAGQGQGQGASLQGKESDFLLGRDTLHVQETLRRKFDRLVIKYVFGESVEPAAGLQIQTPKNEDVTAQLAIDQWFHTAGIEQSKNDLRERYNRVEPEPNADILEKAPGPLEVAEAKAAQAGGRPQPGEEADDEIAMANERLEKAVTADLVKNTAKELRGVQKKALEPIVAQVRKVLALEDPLAVRVGLQRIRANLPGYLQALNRDPAGATIYSNAFAASIFNGIASGALDRNLKN